MNKTACACQFSLEALGRGRDTVYLWTFTSPDVVPVDVCSQRWALLQRDLVRSMGVQGVRVYEMHPGGHGLHVHLVVRNRIDVTAVRALSYKHGFGRINVVKIPASESAYVAKYLTKSRRVNVLKGVRLWACIGKPDGASKVKDIVIDSRITRLLSIVKQNQEMWIRFLPAFACGITEDAKRRLVQNAQYRATMDILYNDDKLFSALSGLGWSYHGII